MWTALSLGSLRGMYTKALEMGISPKGPCQGDMDDGLLLGTSKKW
jgi:hypothetical protein